MLRILRLVALPLLALWILPGPAVAQSAGDGLKVLVLKDGRSMRVKAWRSDGATTYLTMPNGTTMVVRTQMVDFARSEKATAEALRPATPTPTPVRKERSIVEVSREIQERRRREGGAPEPIIPAPTVAAGSVSPTPAAPAGTPAPAPTAAASAPAATPAIAATPEPTPVAAAAASPTAPPPPPPPPPGQPILLYAGAAAAALVVVGGVGFLLRRRKSAARPRPAAQPAGAAKAAGRPAPVAEEEELLRPAFADDASAGDVPAPGADVRFGATPELSAAAAERRALPAPAAAPAAPAPTSVLEPSREYQIRIGTDLYTCPDLPTLKRWVEEGRVIETSEILGADGSWLMAGTIPDLEPSFDRRRSDLGY